MHGETNRGGRLVFGVGNSWPHDFRFLVPLGSSSCSSLIMYSSSGDVGVNRVVSASDTVDRGG